MRNTLKQEDLSTLALMGPPTLRPNLSSLKSKTASIRSVRTTQLQGLRLSSIPRPFKRLTPRISSLRPTSRLKTFLKKARPKVQSTLAPYTMSLMIRLMRFMPLMLLMTQTLQTSPSRPLLLKLATRLSRII